MDIDEAMEIFRQDLIEVRNGARHFTSDSPKRVIIRAMALAHAYGSALLVEAKTAWAIQGPHAVWFYRSRGQFSGSPQEIHCREDSGQRWRVGLAMSRHAMEFALCYGPSAFCCSVSEEK